MREKLIAAVRVKLDLTHLDDRIMPAAVWPFRGGYVTGQLVETWGQYQENTSPGLDYNIHHHEGIDLAMPAGTPVYAVADGRITRISKSATPYFNVIAIEDLNSTSGWNYKHIVLNPDLQERRQVIANVTQIGTVAPSPNPLLFADHLHLDRGSRRDDGSAFVRNWFAPNMNPLPEFGIEAMDPTPPVVDDIRFRSEVDDKLGPNSVQYPMPQAWNPSTGGKFGGQETLRNTARYMKEKIVTDSEVRVVIGRRALAVAESGGKLQYATANANVDIVSSVYDRFGAGSTKLNVYGLTFSIRAASSLELPAEIVSADFSSIPTLTSVKEFGRLNTTRSIYENDAENNTQLNGPYHYILTNTPNSPAVQFGSGGVFKPDNTKNFWNTDVKAGMAWNAAEPGNNADRNAQAEFPDDIYDIIVTALDQAGNSTQKTVSAVLDNWQQTLTLAGARLTTADAVRVAGGEQYKANQTERFYAVKREPPLQSKLDNDSPLNLADFIGEATADANGVLPPTDLIALPEGKYWVVADAGGEQFEPQRAFSRTLDVAVPVAVTPPKPVGGVVAGDDEFTAYFGGEPAMRYEVPALGVLANDSSLSGLPLSLSILTEYIEGFYVNLRNDGSLEIGLYGDGWPPEFTFEYAASDGEALDVATVTIRVSFEAGPDSGGGAGADDVALAALAEWLADEDEVDDLHGAPA